MRTCGWYLAVKERWSSPRWNTLSRGFDLLINLTSFFCSQSRFCDAWITFHIYEINIFLCMDVFSDILKCTRMIVKTQYTSWDGVVTAPERSVFKRFVNFATAITNQQSTVTKILFMLKTALDFFGAQQTLRQIEMILKHAQWCAIAKTRNGLFSSSQ